MTLSSPKMPQDVEVRAGAVPHQEDVLTPDALSFVGDLVRAFRERRDALLKARILRQERLDAGEKLNFLPETASIRQSDWQVARVPDDLLERRVEITGPTDPKMVINALNSGANVFMADFEDATSPTWANLIEGQKSLQGAVRRNLSFEAPGTGKKYALKDKIATLFVRPRGLHLPERHLLVDGVAAPGAFVDFGLFFFHNAKEQLARGTGPYFYLPKLESHLEARLWNDVFHWAQSRLDIARGSIKATVLIETLPAAFEMDEILYELREHSAGLNCGRWDYIFSFIKKHRAHRDALLPDRSQVTMDKAFLRAYSLLLIQTCHRRCAHAMGGMAAQIPVKNDQKAHEAAISKVRADKEREAKDGHDGTWVAHPGLVEIARSVFDEHMKTKNQLEVKREDVTIGQADLLRIPQGTRTEEGLRHNVRVGVQYLSAWLEGLGCVPLYSLMEDAATAEICRAQVWQQLKHGAEIEGLGVLTEKTVLRVLDEELAHVREELGEETFAKGRFDEAKRLFAQLVTAPTFEEFLTLPAYEALTNHEVSPA